MSFVIVRLKENESSRRTNDLEIHDNDPFVFMNRRERSHIEKKDAVQSMGNL